MFFPGNMTPVHVVHDEKKISKFLFVFTQFRARLPPWPNHNALKFFLMLNSSFPSIVLFSQQQSCSVCILGQLCILDSKDEVRQDQERFSEKNFHFWPFAFRYGFIYQVNKLSYLNPSLVLPVYCSPFRSVEQLICPLLL